MIDPNPETRITIDKISGHAWMNGPTAEFGEAKDSIDNWIAEEEEK